MRCVEIAWMQVLGERGCEQKKELGKLVGTGRRAGKEVGAPRKSAPW